MFPKIKIINITYAKETERFAGCCPPGISSHTAYPASKEVT